MSAERQVKIITPYSDTFNVIIKVLLLSHLMQISCLNCFVKLIFQENVVYKRLQINLPCFGFSHTHTYTYITNKYTCVNKLFTIFFQRTRRRNTFASIGRLPPKQIHRKSANLIVWFDL